MERTLVTCDHCGAEKRDTNYWWRVRQIRAPTTTTGPMFQIRAWGWLNETTAMTEIIRTAAEPEMHLCGEACVVAKISEFMGASQADAARSES